MRHPEEANPQRRRTGQQLPAAGAREQGETANRCGVSFWRMRMFGTRWSWWLYNTVHESNATELFS